MNERFAKAFAEWMRKYQQEPEAFEKDWLSAGSDADDYGTRAAKYFERLLLEQEQPA